MGFTPVRRVYTLQFEQYDGLEVRAAATSAGGFLELTERSDAASADISKVKPLLELFVECLRSWNLEDDEGQPVPQTVDGLLTLELDFVMEIIGAWTEAVAGVSSDLKEPSNSGTPSLVESLPMVTLSDSQAS